MRILESIPIPRRTLSHRYQEGREAWYVSIRLHYSRSREQRLQFSDLTVTVAHCASGTNQSIWVACLFCEVYMHVSVA